MQDFRNFGESRLHKPKIIINLEASKIKVFLKDLIDDLSK